MGKLTPEQREAIVLEYLGDEAPTMRELGVKYGVSTQTVSKIISDSKTLRKLEERARASVARAMIRAQMNADEMMRLTIADAKQTREDKYGHLHQNARRDVLDRAGVRIKESEDSTLTIKFADGSGFELGETQDVEVSEE